MLLASAGGRPDALAADSLHKHIIALHPVSIARFLLRRFSPGAGLLRYVFFIGGGEDFPGAGSEKTGIF